MALDRLRVLLNIILLLLLLLLLLINRPRKEGWDAELVHSSRGRESNPRRRYRKSATTYRQNINYNINNNQRKLSKNEEGFIHRNPRAINRDIPSN